MLLIYGDEHALDDEARDACYVESAALSRDLAASGHFIGANPLHLTNSATSVYVKGNILLGRSILHGPMRSKKIFYNG